MMNKIDQLLQKYCPEGVIIKDLSSLEDDGIIKLGRGNVISKNDIRNYPGDYPIYSSSAQGLGEFGRYSKYMFDEELITWSIDGGGRFFFRGKHKYSVTNVSGWLRNLNEEKLFLKFLYYVLSNEWKTKFYDYTNKAHPSVIRNDYYIPLPPLPVQEEIVRILDEFTELEAELEIELEARTKQYEYYRNTLLDFSTGKVGFPKIDQLLQKYCPEGVQYKSIEEIGKFRRGSFPQPYGLAKWYDDVNGMPFVQVFDLEEDRFLIKDKTKKKISLLAQKSSIFVPVGSLIITIQGTIGRIAITQYDSFVDRTLLIFTQIDNSININFLAYVLKIKFALEKKTARGSTLKTITKEELKEFFLPVPPLPIQEEIVRILDEFSEHTTSLTKGLPAEIELRKKQYEYYRNHLLTF
jgi:type I restriction enzyme, S subunit